MLSCLRVKIQVICLISDFFQLWEGLSYYVTLPTDTLWLSFRLRIYSWCSLSSASVFLCRISSSFFLWWWQLLSILFLKMGSTITDLLLQKFFSIIKNTITWFSHASGVFCERGQMIVWMAINDLYLGLYNVCSAKQYNRMCLNGYCLCISLIALITLSVFVSRLNQDLIQMRRQIWKAKNEGSSAFTCLQICGLKLPYQQVQQTCCVMKEVEDCRSKSDCFVEYIATREKEISSIAVMDQYAIGLQTIMFFVFLMNTYGVCYKLRHQTSIAAREDQRRHAIMASIIIEVQEYVEQSGHNKKKILTQSFISEQYEEMCAVCLQSFGEERVIKLKCSHVFHRGCIEEWINNHSTCPVCRAPQ